MKYLAVLGRQAEISLTELDFLYDNVCHLYGKNRRLYVNLATFDSKTPPNIDRLGGTLKIARELQIGPVEFLMNLPAGKITLAVSDYSPGATAKKTAAEALKLKKILARQGRSVRVLPNTSVTISTATAHHNQLSEKTNHIELIKLQKTWWVLVGVQNITAYARRDQARPARDARVGMLPPKLAQILINLCGPLPTGSRLLDPFCGTGVVLQEARRMGYQIIGSDLEPRMVDYTRRNLKWLFGEATDFPLDPGDATSFEWQPPIHAVACETYLGRPMSAPPAEIKLKTEQQTCASIVLGFLKNLSHQIAPGTPVVIAVPAWLRSNGTYEKLGVIDEIGKLGYNVIKYKFAGDGLLYHREGQIVAREIIALRKK